MLKRTRIIFAAAVASVVALTGCTATPEPGETSTVKRDVSIMILQGAWQTSTAPLIVAEELGYFADEGLKVNWSSSTNAATVAAQVEQNAVDFALVAPEPRVLGASTGLTSQYFALLYRNSIFGVAVPENSPIKDPGDLAGRTIGVQSLASSGVAIAVAQAEAAGLAREDLQFVAIGAGAQALAALEAGQVDAVSLYDTAYQMFADNDFPVRQLDRSAIENLTSGGFLALPGNLETKPELFVGATRAIMKGYLFASLNPEATLEIFWKRFPELKPSGLSDAAAIKQEAAILNVRMETSITPAEGEAWGSFRPGAMEDFLEYMKSSGQLTGDLDVDTLFTDELIDQINDFDSDEVRGEAESY